MNDLPNSPCCNAPVEITNSRDLDVLSWYVSCSKCENNFFHHDTMAFIKMPTGDEELIAKKYIAWVATNPKCYREDRWE